MIARAASWWRRYGVRIHVHTITAAPPAQLRVRVLQAVRDREPGDRRATGEAATRRPAPDKTREIDCE